MRYHCRHSRPFGVETLSTFVYRLGKREKKIFYIIETYNLLGTMRLIVCSQKKMFLSKFCFLCEKHNVPINNDAEILYIPRDVIIL